MNKAMNTIKLKSIQPLGLKNESIEIEASVLSGMQNLTLTGLAEARLKDSRDKIRSLLHQHGYWDPVDRIVVNLNPPELIKTGQHLELPIFLAAYLLLNRRSLGEEDWSGLEKFNFAGSLSLNGEILHTSYTQSVVAHELKFISADQYSQLDALIEDIVKDQIVCLPQRTPEKHDAFIKKASAEVELQGRWVERLALCAAAVIRAPVLLLGPPGVGKSHLAKWASALIEFQDGDHAREVEKIWSIAGLRAEGFKVPLLCPHSRAQLAEFIGYKSGGVLRPGYFSLAHHGVLLLDEFSELARNIREILRNVLDEKRIRAFNGHSFVDWPADFWLLATSNPCACGGARPMDLSDCRCAVSTLKTYQNRFSGPLLDRFALQLFLTEKDFAFDGEEALQDWQSLKLKLGGSMDDLRRWVAEARQNFKVEKISDERGRRGRITNDLYSALLSLGVSQEWARWWALQWSKKFSLQ